MYYVHQQQKAVEIIQLITRGPNHAIIAIS